jgi:peptidoglycan hydrolase-like protein with peptidoglycan-binding domain
VTTILRQGQIGDRVTSMQRMLAQSGDYEGFIDGLYGPLTQTAVDAWRQRVGLGPGPWTTEVSAATRGYLKSLPGVR